MVQLPFGRAAGQVGTKLADEGEACRGSPPLRYGCTRWALRGRDALGLRHVLLVDW